MTFRKNETKGGIGIFDFAVLAIYKIGFPFFFFCQETLVFSVLVFIVVCGFSVFQHLVLRFVKKH